MLIGIVGLIGSGKDTVAERLVQQHGYIKDSFAKSLKIILLLFSKLLLLFPFYTARISQNFQT